MCDLRHQQTVLSPELPIRPESQFICSLGLILLLPSSLYRCWSLINIVHHQIPFQCLLLEASLVVQLVKDLPAMQETLVSFLGLEDPLEKGQATQFSIPGLPL